MGELRRLQRLHDLLSGRFNHGDRLVYLGNYCGVGDTVLPVMDELLDFRRRVLGRVHGSACDVVFLRGAREEMLQKLLQLQFAPNPAEILAWMVQAGLTGVIEAYGGDLRLGFVASRDGPRMITRWTSGIRAAMNAAPGHTALFATLRHAAFSGERDLLLVHAAVDPARPVAAQGDAFWWGGSDLLALTAPFDGFRKVVRGYARSGTRLSETEFALSLDGGAGRGGVLRAACLSPEGTLLDSLEA